jgi:DNA transposition AAA+ family ATPase
MTGDMREKTRRYMERQGLSRAEMGTRIGVTARALNSYLYQVRGCHARQIEAALVAYFQREELINRQKGKTFLELRTSKLVLERCEEARLEKELVVLYGPPGISKTYSLREYVRRRAEAGDRALVMITANAVSTPRSLVMVMCRQLALPTKKQTHALVEDVIEKLIADPHLVLVDEANHLNVAGLELLRHVHDMAEVGIVLVGTKRLYDLFTNGGRKSQDLEQLWSRVAIHDLLPGLAAAEVRQIVNVSLAHMNEVAAKEIERTARGSVRRLAKMIPRLKRLERLNPGTPREKLVPVAAGQIMA